MTCTHIRAIWLASILLVGAAAPLMSAHAQSTSLIFERSEIRIDSPAPDEKTKNPKPPHPSVRYNVEVRGEDALKLEYIHTLNTLSDGNGVMIVFDAPSIVSLPAMKVYTPVDVIFIADDGMIEQISPNVVLGDITQNVHAKPPVKAFLFTKAGSAAAQGLHPHDTVAGSMFTPPLPTQE